MQAYEVNFDGIVGPTHYYGGFSHGNIASMDNACKPSNPKTAALQGLEKMKVLSDLGLKQAVLPPHERPAIDQFRQFGFTGSDQEILQNAHRHSPQLFYQCCSSASMWAANAATICPSSDSEDGRVHVTPANLSTMFHRALEPATTFRIVSGIFAGSTHFAIHHPLPYGVHFSDEGAANHTRLCKSHPLPGIHLFVFGRSSMQKGLPATQRFPARQSLEASEAIARLHLISQQHLVYAQQNPVAIDAGVFHNDVASVGNEHLFLYHEDAFINTQSTIELLQNKFSSHFDKELCCIKVSRQELSLEEAVRTYLFNSQIVTLADGTMALIAPIECKELPAAKSLLDQLLRSSGNPISRLEYVDLRQSMQNGGGPACLRLRVVLTEQELSNTNPHVFLTDSLYLKLKEWIHRYYRDHLTLQDLADPQLLAEVHQALDELTQILDLGSLYSFQCY